MGGRGGSSTRSSESFYSPQLSGSEKQVSWARDILREPYINAGYRITKNLELNRQTNGGARSDFVVEAEAYRSAQKIYNEQIKLMEKRAGGTIPAKTIIDRRFSFKSAMEKIIFQELDKRGKNPFKR